MVNCHEINQERQCTKCFPVIPNNNAFNISGFIKLKNNIRPVPVAARSKA